MPDFFISPESALAEIGLSGLKRSGGIVQMDPLRELRGPEGMKRLKEMEYNDPVIGGLLFAIDYLIRQATWELESANDSSQAEEVRQFVWDCLHDMNRSWQELLSEILSMLVYGWSLHEPVFKYRRGPNPDSGPPSRFNDGKVGWHKIAGRAQDSLDEWVFDEHGEVLAFKQRPEPDFQVRTIPYQKFLLFRTTSKYNNPEGRSILRNAYRPWYLKKNIENIQAIGIERDLAGLPVLHVPPEYLNPSASEQHRAMLEEFKSLVRNIRRDEQEGVILPRVYDESGHLMFELTLMSSQSRRAFDTKAIIEYYDQRIAMTAMADFLLLGHEQNGSFALSSNKTHLLSSALGALMSGIAEQFNNKGIPQLLLLNGISLDLMPRLKPGDIETSDLGVLGTFIQQIAGAGFQVAMDTELENKLREQAGLPPRDPSMPTTEDLMRERDEDRKTRLEQMRARASQKPPPGPERRTEREMERNRDRDDG